MGWGDELIASGLARQAASRGKRAAFGDGKRIIWSEQAGELFRGNPHVAPPGDDRFADLEWIEHYRGNRLYGHSVNGVWRFRDFACPPGEVFLTQEEKIFGLARMWSTSDPVVVIEPRVKPMGACNGANKQWPVERYEALACALRWERGLRCVQLVPPSVPPALRFADAIETPSFRHALAIIGLASLYIGPEGGLHHGAAAMGTPAVVIFGGFNTPRSTGYPWHENITVGEPCGRVAACEHCREAMASISVDQVLDAALRQMGQREAA
jgi:ADP-heptose:LPS heptosyltransferase